MHKNDPGRHDFLSHQKNKKGNSKEICADFDVFLCTSCATGCNRSMISKIRIRHENYYLLHISSLLLSSLLLHHSPRPRRFFQSTCLWYHTVVGNSDFGIAYMYYKNLIYCIVFIPRQTHSNHFFNTSHIDTL